MKAESDALVCVSCGSTYAPEERFCPACHIPLSVDGDAEPVSERHARARKLKPQLAEGELVRVAGARNQAEAEFIQGLLLEEGVPSILRRTAGFDVPDFLAAGPRDVLVPQTGVEEHLRQPIRPIIQLRVGNHFSRPRHHIRGVLRPF